MGEIALTENYLYDVEGEERRLLTTREDMFEILRDKVGSDFASFVQRNLEDKAYRQKLEFESDFDCLERSNDGLRSVLCDVQEEIQSYLDDLDSGKQKFSRQRVLPILNRVVDMIQEVL